MNYVRRLIIAVIVFVILSTAWYGAEMLIHGHSDKSVVDTVIAILISLAISGSVEKEAEQNDRKREFAERFGKEFVKAINERKEAENGKDDVSKRA